MNEINTGKFWLLIGFNVEKGQSHCLAISTSREALIGFILEQAPNYIDHFTGYAIEEHGNILPQIDLNRGNNVAQTHPSSTAKN